MRDSVIDYWFFQQLRWPTRRPLIESDRPLKILLLRGVGPTWPGLDLTLSYPSQTFGIFHIHTHKITEIRYTWAGLNRGHSEHISQGEDDVLQQQPAPLVCHAHATTTPPFVVPVANICVQCLTS